MSGGLFQSRGITEQFSRTIQVNDFNPIHESATENVTLVAGVHPIIAKIVRDMLSFQVHYSVEKRITENKLLAHRIDLFCDIKSMHSEFMNGIAGDYAAFKRLQAEGKVSEDHLQHMEELRLEVLTRFGIDMYNITAQEQVQKEVTEPKKVINLDIAKPLNAFEQNTQVVTTEETKVVEQVKPANVDHIIDGINDIDQLLKLG